MNRIRTIVLAVLVWGLAGCGTMEVERGAGKEPPSRVTRGECLAIAQSYESHEWTPRAANVRHGADSRGIRVDTPDISWQPKDGSPGYWVPSRPARGIPYQWGGFCTPEEFDRKIAQGFAAGDVYTSEKRRRLEDAVSLEAAGIDCSGFVSRCWKLPRSFSTRELAGLCDPLASLNDLRPGDALNLHNQHVLLFDGWLDHRRTLLAARETGGPPHWFVTRHAVPVDFLVEKGYRPLRYRGMVD